MGPKKDPTRGWGDHRTPPWIVLFGGAGEKTKKIKEEERDGKVNVGFSGKTGLLGRGAGSLTGKVERGGKVKGGKLEAKGV